MNFKEAQEYLDSLQFHKIKLGLEAMESFLARVQHPEKKLRFVHVAGTNGKGSVSVTLLTLLQRSGYRVGLYTSPHLSNVRERFRINDGYIDEKSFARIATDIRSVLGEEMITYFEFTTALALLWFAESNLDLVILETGLGGRLDATNVVTPLVSVITNVSMDHEAYLGNDLESVAGEKAGIIKQGVPVVSGTAYDISRKVVERTCSRLGAKLFQHGVDFSVEHEEDGWGWSTHHQDLGGVQYHGLKCSMKGSYQRTNASLALAVMELLRSSGIGVEEAAIRPALLAVQWPGRLEYLVLDRYSRKQVSLNGEGDCLRYLIDGAHNPAGVESLVATLKTEYSYEKLIVIWGAMIDKDLEQTVPEIAHMATTIILTMPEGERSAEPAEILKHLQKGDAQKAQCIRDVKEALRVAEEQADSEDMIVVAGSLYLIGAVRSLLVGELVEA